MFRQSKRRFHFSVAYLLFCFFVWSLYLPITAVVHTHPESHKIHAGRLAQSASEISHVLKHFLSDTHGHHHPSSPEAHSSLVLNFTFPGSKFVSKNQLHQHKLEHFNAYSLPQIIDPISRIFQFSQINFTPIHTAFNSLKFGFPPRAPPVIA